MTASLQLIWGCDPERQFERAWLASLLHPLELREVRSDATGSVSREMPRMLVETGLLRLERQLDPQRLANQQRERQHRLQKISESGPFVLVHLSDEEGLDGEIGRAHV